MWMFYGLSLTQALLIGAITTGMVYWRYWRWSNSRLLELAEKLPGPPPLPIIGNALIFISKPEEQLEKITKLVRQYGEYMRFWLGPDLNIAVQNPADIRFLLTSAKVNQKGPVYDSLTAYIGHGFLTGGPLWRYYRKMATPSYSKKNVQNFEKVFNAEINELVGKIKTKDPKNTYNIFLDIRQCTTQCVCQTLMGLSKEDSLKVKNMDEVVLATQSMYKAVYQRITCWWLQIPLIRWLTGYTKKEAANVELIHEMFKDVIAKRKRAIAIEGYIGGEHMGVVDRFIQNGLSELEIIQESFTLFTTSQEAAAKIASAVILFLAHLPDWQERVYNEIIEMCGDSDENLTDEQLKRLEYLDMVYKEALRYLAIAALIQRKVEQEVTIKKGKITLPAGTSLAFPIHALHRDPKYWDEPDRVMPERFLPENVKKRDPNAFVPFSLGPMDCLGRVYANSMIKSLVVNLVKHIRFEADGKLEDLDIDIAISVKFTNGYNIRSRPRMAPSNGVSRNGSIPTAANGKLNSSSNGTISATTNGKIPTSAYGAVSTSANGKINKSANGSIHHTTYGKIAT